MSTPSIPDGMMPQMKQFEEMTKAARDAMPQELASAVNLMAHPMAGAAAAGAIGVGFASHAFGLWLGTVAGAAEASRKMMEGVAPADPASETKPKPKRPAVKLKLVEKPAAPVARPVAKVVSAPVPEQLATAAEAVSGARDDLKAISGIGPKLEKVLNDLGISSWAQVAALSDAEIAKLDEQLGFAGRIARDDWIGQAKALTGGK